MDKKYNKHNDPDFYKSPERLERELETIMYLEKIKKDGAPKSLTSPSSNERQVDKFLTVGGKEIF